MTRRQICNELALELGITQVAARDVVNRFLVKVIKAIADGDGIELRGFGVFDVHKSKPRTGRNPRTGERVEVPAKSRVRFKAGDELIAALAENDRIASEIDARFADSDREDFEETPR